MDVSCDVDTWKLSTEVDAVKLLVKVLKSVTGPDEDILVGLAANIVDVGAITNVFTVLVSGVDATCDIDVCADCVVDHGTCIVVLGRICESADTSVENIDNDSADDGETGNGVDTVDAESTVYVEVCDIVELGSIATTEVV